MSVETEVHKANTEAWVDSDPIDIELIRTTRVDDGAGGTKDGGDQTLPPQTFRLDRSGNQVVAMFVNEDGIQVPQRFRIVGPPTSDVKQGDRFHSMGAQFQVSYVQRITFERIAAEVEYHGL